MAEALLYQNTITAGGPVQLFFNNCVKCAGDAGNRPSSSNHNHHPPVEATQHDTAQASKGALIPSRTTIQECTLESVTSSAVARQESRRSINLLEQSFLVMGTIDHLTNQLRQLLDPSTKHRDLIFQLGEIKTFTIPLIFNVFGVNRKGLSYESRSIGKLVLQEIGHMGNILDEIKKYLEESQREATEEAVPALVLHKVLYTVWDYFRSFVDNNAATSRFFAHLEELTACQLKINGYFASIGAGCHDPQRRIRLHQIEICDFFGMSWSLPRELCFRREVFIQILRLKFEDGPAKQVVSSGFFNVFHRKSLKLINNDVWTLAIEGSEGLQLSVVVPSQSQVRTTSDVSGIRCPRCGSGKTKIRSDSEWADCFTCDSSFTIAQSRPIPEDEIEELQSPFSNGSSSKPQVGDGPSGGFIFKIYSVLQAQSHGSATVEQSDLLTNGAPETTPAFPKTPSKKWSLSNLRLGDSSCSPPSNDRLTNQVPDALSPQKHQHPGAMSPDEYWASSSDVDSRSALLASKRHSSKRLTPSSIPFFRRSSSPVPSQNSHDMPSASINEPVQKKSSMLSLGLSSLLKPGSERVRPEKTEDKKEEKDRSDSRISVLMGRKRGKVLSSTDPRKANSPVSLPPMQLNIPAQLRTSQGSTSSGSALMVTNVTNSKHSSKEFEERVISMLKSIEEQALLGDEEMAHYIRRQHARKLATGAGQVELDDMLKFPEHLSPGTPLSPQLIIESHSHQLSDYERKEILDYPSVYYWGETSKKKTATPDETTNNFGYDDDRGDYQIVKHDHLAYRFEVIDTLGMGSFGQVVQCRDHCTGMSLAVKIIRNKKRFHHQTLVEIKILENLRKWDSDDKHHVLKMTEHFYFRNHLCIVTELLSINLYELIKANGFCGLSTALIRRFTGQILLSLSLLRHHRIIHGDLKPENILLQNPFKSAIKVIDFGASCFEHEKIYTYIQARSYRSPEVILGMTYHMAIDMWSLGCIVAELYTGFLIFPGENEQEQLSCIMEVLGIPEKEYINRSSRKKLFFDPSGAPRPVVDSKGRRRRPGTKTLSQVLRSTDEDFLDFIARCLVWDPERRMKPQAALRHPFITGGRTLNASISSTKASTFDLSGSESTLKTPGNPQINVPTLLTARSSRTDARVDMNPSTTGASTG